MFHIQLNPTAENTNTAADLLEIWTGQNRSWGWCSPGLCHNWDWPTSVLLVPLPMTPTARGHIIKEGLIQFLQHLLLSQIAMRIASNWRLRIGKQSRKINSILCWFIRRLQNKPINRAWGLLVSINGSWSKLLCGTESFLSLKIL